MNPMSRAHCASRLLEILDGTHSTPDNAFWENLDFLDRVLYAAVSSEKDNRDYRMFTRACELANVVPKDIVQLVEKIGDYKFIISLHGAGERTPPGLDLPQREKELRDICHAIIAYDGREQLSAVLACAGR